VPVPTDGLCFRGGGLKDEHKSFFTAGKVYRYPGFLATSLREDCCDRFLFLAVEEQGLPPVKWIIHLDPRGDEKHPEHKFEFQCKHVNFVHNSLTSNEYEYLFTQFSIFTVISVDWSTSRRPNPRSPHVIHLQAAVDNYAHPEDAKLDPEDLPSAPWG
jgi:hypothetical protein